MIVEDVILEKYPLWNKNGHAFTFLKNFSIKMFDQFRASPGIYIYKKKPNLLFLRTCDLKTA